jgi:hypothetical protein
MAMGHGDGAVRVELDVDGIQLAVQRIRAELARTLPKALQRAGDLVAESARREHAYRDRTGNLTRSIYADPAQTAGNGAVFVDVAANADYAAFVEHGTKAHKILARKAKVLAFPGRGGGMVFRHEVNHPGTKPYNFMSGALEREHGDVEAEIEDAFLSAFEVVGFEVMP